MKPTGWDQFLLDITYDYDIRGKLKEVFLARFAYENWRKSDLDVWEIAEAASHETYKKQMTQIYGVFASDKPNGCPELNASSRGPGKFQLLRDWFKEIKYPEWQSNQGIAPSVGAMLSQILPRATTLQNAPYIFRPPVEQQGLEEIARPGGLLRLKAPTKMGKTTLLQWLLHAVQESGDRQVYLNLLTAESAMLSQLDKFLRWFVANISRELGLKPNLDDYWDEELFGSLVSCKTYMQNYVLAASEQPLILAIDNLDRLFDFPAIANDFLPMLRYWHEESKNLPQWQQLRLVIANSTESYIKLDANQSPFNVGRQLKLPGFTLEQVQTLVTSLQLPSELVTLDPLRNLVELVGGHPYLVQLALAAVQQEKVSVGELLTTAETQSGIFSPHLRHQWGLVNQTPTLIEPLKQVVGATEPQQLDPFVAYRLESMGLVTLVGDTCQPSCRLYQHYFQEQL